ncbi:MAG: cytochrome c biogenesis protein CcdA [Chloroflexota bacterium]|nr:cytochrome c biogenesis protein CcdA [Chloroflexota bacterium]
MSEYVGAFLLGNAAILGNVCVLPLYPGLIAFLAGTRQHGRAGQGGVLLGASVLAGVLVMMIALGFVLFALGQSFSRILPWLLPVIYGIVIILGLAMLMGKNPFARLATTRTPMLFNPYAAAFLYGGLLAPMTLPCTGPVIIGALVLGVGSAAMLGESLLYFLAFGIGFGWPLLVLPLVAAPLQRSITHWLAGHARAWDRLAGAVLLAIAAFGIWVDIVPNVRG